MREQGPPQLPLFDPELDLGAEPTLADCCVLKLARQFRVGYLAQGLPERLPDDLDLMSLGCLLVVVEFRPNPTTALIRELRSCRDCLQTEPTWRVFDSLPFDLCLELLGDTSGGRGRLLENLRNGLSSVRAYCLEIAWLYRGHLSTTGRASPIAERLLANVEDMLLYWDISLALCRQLFPTESSFWAFVESYQASGMPDQYAGRIEKARENPGVLEFPMHFLYLELRVRTLLNDSLLCERLASLQAAFEQLQPSAD